MPKFINALIRALFALYATRYVPPMNLTQKQLAALKRACERSNG